jgi:inosose dehydratase
MKLGNAPCSWGVFYPTGNSVTALAYLDAIARAGYRFTELGPLGFMGTDAASEPALTAALHQLGGLLRDLDARDLILMDESEAYPVAAQGVVDAAGWQTAMGMIARAHGLMREEYGIRLHVHPHVGTCIEREAQIDRLLNQTEVSLCFDTGHHAFWDQDVLAYMNRVWDRIGYIHLKNVDPVVRARVLAGELGVNASFDVGVMSPLATGAVDIPGVMACLMAKGVDGFCVVEQDLAAGPGPDPEALARDNLAYLTRLMGD